MDSSGESVSGIGVKYVAFPPWISRRIGICVDLSISYRQAQETREGGRQKLAQVDPRSWHQGVVPGEAG